MRIRIAVPVNPRAVPTTFPELGDYVDTINRYLPGNYQAVMVANTVVIVGKDHAGWTMDDYVIPRLASGLHWYQEQT